jgi:hypothetical protein
MATLVALMIAGNLITDGTAIVGPVKVTETETAVPVDRGVVLGDIET